MHNIKKILMTIPVAAAFSFSILGTNAYAVSNKTITTISSQSSADSQTNDNNSNSKINSTNGKITDTNNSTSNADVDSSKKSPNSSTNVTDKNTIDKNVINSNENLTDSENTSDLDDQNNELIDDIVSEPIVPHWENIDGKLHYVTEDGIVEEKGWFKEKDENPNADNNYDYYLDNNYAAVIGWKQISGQWYYFNEAGIKQTGWQLIDYNWYHLDEDGMMEKGWIKDDGYKYYLNESGTMVLGKKNIDGNWYFFSNTGKLQTGFYTYTGTDYYSDKDGVMVTNQWIKTKSNKYYAKADSSIAKGSIIIDGNLEIFDDNGKYKDTEELEDYLYVKYLNVGNADCQFIKLPSGETALIDTGDVSTRKDLIDFLNEQELIKKNGKKYIDYVIITHGHSDHIGGLEAVLENFQVGKLYMPKNAVMKDWHSDLKVSKTVTQADIDMLKYDYEVYNDAIKAVKAKKLKFINPEHGDYIDSDNILQFVQSGKNFGAIGSQKHLGEYWGMNENSAIVYLNYGDFQCLFTADMEWNSEKDFWVNDLLDGREVDLLKVPHHGKDTSSTGDFLKYVNAQVGVISRAEDSIEQNTAYNNLISKGVNIYETSQNKNGGIEVYSTEENWSMNFKAD